MDIEVLEDCSAVAAPAAPGAGGEGRVAIVGLGNIGSFTADLLARAPEVKHVLLIDPQTYDPSNLRSQNIEAAAVALPKVRVTARRLAAIRRDLRVEALALEVQAVPLGKLQVDVLCGCLDSRGARLYLNEVARVLGVPWVDAGVEPSSLLARVNAYRPQPDDPCYECAFSAEDYRRLDVTYPCARGGTQAPATHAPASLGALAAALQSVEVVKILRGQWHQAVVGRQITVAAGTHKHYVTALPVNPACRCPHAAWKIQTGLAAERPLREVAAAWPGAELSVLGQTLVRQMACDACEFRARERPVGILSGRWPARRRKCPHCGAPLRPLGFSQADGVILGALPRTVLDWPLAALGLINGDIVTLRQGNGEWHVRLGDGVANGLSNERPL